MAQTVSQVLRNKSPYSTAEYTFLKSRSDGRLPDRTMPASKQDKVIHFSHIFDSSQYNIRHDHDHTEEFVFDVSRLRKEGKDELADQLCSQFRSVMNKQLSKIGLKVCDGKGCHCA